MRPFVRNATPHNRLTLMHRSALLAALLIALPAAVRGQAHEHGVARLDVGLFDAFAGMQRIDVQVATPKGQLKRGLKRPANRISLQR